MMGEENCWKTSGMRRRIKNISLYENLTHVYYIHAEAGLSAPFN